MIEGQVVVIRTIPDPGTDLLLAAGGSLPVLEMVGSPGSSGHRRTYRARTARVRGE